jgi:hypothetical protein
MYQLLIGLARLLTSKTFLDRFHELYRYTKGSSDWNSELRWHKRRFRRDQAVGRQQEGKFAGPIHDHWMPCSFGSDVTSGKRVYSCLQRLGRWQAGWPLSAERCHFAALLPAECQMIFARRSLIWINARPREG